MGFVMIEITEKICYSYCMNTRALNKRPTLKNLANEVSLLRSFVIGLAWTDSEGTYRPEFIEEMLRASTSDTPRREFVNGRDLLQRLHRPA